MHRILELQRRLGRAAWLHDYYLASRRQQMLLDFKPPSEDKQKEVAAK